MSAKILVVTPEMDFCKQLQTAINERRENMELSFVPGRQEALQRLRQHTFDRVITGLKIPRVSDGYLFLTHLTKTVTEEKIIVISEDPNPELQRSIGGLGIEALLYMNDIPRILSGLLKSATKTADDAKTEGLTQATAAGNYDAAKIMATINWVMGPVGKMIYDDAMEELADKNDLDQLLARIAEEIDDPSKIELFYNKLKE